MDSEKRDSIIVEVLKFVLQILKFGIYHHSRGKEKKTDEQKTSSPQ